MAHWKWLLASLIFAFVVENSEVGVVHSKFEIPSGGAFLSGTVRPGVDGGLKPNWEFVAASKYVPPTDFEVKPYFIPALKKSVSEVIVAKFIDDEILLKKRDFFFCRSVRVNRLASDLFRICLNPSQDPWATGKSANIMNRCIARNPNMAGRRLARIFNFEGGSYAFLGQPITGRFAVQVGPHLRLADAPRFDYSIFSGFCGPLSFNDHILGRVGSAAGVVQSSNDSHEGGKCEQYSRESGPEHQLGPFRHALLGAQIAYFAILLPLTLYLVFLGYQIANGALDALERGRWVNGGWRLISAVIVACGSALLLPALGYWLAFEGGILRFL